MERVAMSRGPERKTQSGENEPAQNEHAARDGQRESGGEEQDIACADAHPGDHNAYNKRHNPACDERPGQRKPCLEQLFWRGKHVERRSRHIVDQRTQRRHWRGRFGQIAQCGGDGHATDTPRGKPDRYQRDHEAKTKRGNHTIWLDGDLQWKANALDDRADDLDDQHSNSQPADHPDKSRSNIVRRALKEQHTHDMFAPHAKSACHAEFRAPLCRQKHKDQEDEQ
jgi:hypothetical protein